MEYTEIPGTDMMVSRIGLGTWAIGGWLWGGTNEDDSLRTIRAAFDAGINLIDTAPVYGFGISEEFVGKAIKQHGNRDQIIIATKAGLEWNDNGIVRNSEKRRIMAEIDQSLRRLQTDYIDIYQVHWPDPLVPIGETAAAMNYLLQQGKIRAIGVSNYSVEQIELFRQEAPLHTSQPPYNLFERGSERQIIPHCRQNRITLLTYFALCRGLLSGMMTPDRHFGEDDLRHRDPKFRPPRYEQYLAAVEALDQFAQEHFNRRVLHLAVRWILDQGVDVALWGARRPDQITPVPEIIGWNISSDARRAIDAILDRILTDPAPEGFPQPSERESRGVS